MDTYPTGTIRQLLESDAVTAVTRTALQKRLDPHKNGALTFFTAAQMSLLRAVASRLIPQTDRATPIDIAAEIDERLTEGSGNGWRFAKLPTDEQAYLAGVIGIEQSAMHLHAVSFIVLAVEQQDEILRLVQCGNAPGEVWQTLNASLFFEELLADLAEAYYSHPLAQEEIGYVGMADAAGWQRIGLDELEEREPRQQAPE